MVARMRETQMERTLSVMDASLRKPSAAGVLCRRGGKESRRRRVGRIALRSMHPTSFAFVNLVADIGQVLADTKNDDHHLTPESHRERTDDEHHQAADHARDE